MCRKLLIINILVCILFVTGCEPSAHFYKATDTRDLLLYVIPPEDEVAKPQNPAIVFFHGGSWQGGTPNQFSKHAFYFASRGAVAILPHYRVKGDDGTTPIESVKDAKSVIRWVRANAHLLGVDPNRIVASGASAGGHMAACTGIVPGLDEANEDRSVSSAPNAMVLIKPPLGLPPEMRVEEGLLRGKAVSISPVRHVRKGLPPTIIFAGTKDSTVPYNTVVEFTKTMNSYGNYCKLVPIEGAGHDLGNSSDLGLLIILLETDKFLYEQGILDTPPEDL